MSDPTLFRTILSCVGKRIISHSLAFTLLSNVVLTIILYVEIRTYEKDGKTNL